MSETHHPRHIGRSIGAVLTGIVAGIILTIGTDVVLHAIGIFPPRGQPIGANPLLLATAYRTGYGVADSYIAARIAPDRPMQHALAGGAVGLALSIAGGGDVEPRARLRAPLVSTRTHRARDACAWKAGRLRVIQLRPRVDG